MHQLLKFTKESGHFFVYTYVPSLKPFNPIINDKKKQPLPEKPYLEVKQLF